jgi:hypothetical protein
MSFISSFAEKLGMSKKPENTVITPSPTLEAKKQDAANLEAMMSQGRDFAHPNDAKRLEELRAQIQNEEAQQVPQVIAQPEAQQPMGPTLVPEPQEVPTPLHQPAEQPAAEQTKVA